MNTIDCLLPYGLMGVNTDLPGFIVFFILNSSGDNGLFFSSYLPLTHFALVFPFDQNLEKNYSPHCGHFYFQRDAMISKTNVECICWAPSTFSVGQMGAWGRGTDLAH